MQRQPHPLQPEKSCTEPTLAQPGLLGSCDGAVDIPSLLSSQAAELHELRGEVERLRAERDRLSERQRQVAELLGSPSPEKIVHDLRNLLNEVQLYKVLAEMEER